MLHLRCLLLAISAPSYRRLPHVTWVDSMSLVVDLLVGAGKQRYLRTVPTQLDRREVYVRGFSAGSYIVDYASCTCCGGCRISRPQVSLVVLLVLLSCCPLSLLRKGRTYISFIICVFLWLCFFAGAVAWLCFCGGVVVCFCGGVAVFLCFCGAVVILWWCGCVFVVSWCFCG